MKTQMVKWGNSLAVRIPKHVVERARLKEGDSLEIEAPAEGQVELRRPTKIPSTVCPARSCTILRPGPSPTPAA